MGQIIALPAEMERYLI